VYFNVKAKAFGVVLALVGCEALAQSELDSLKNISGELVRVRQQIETLHSQINFAKESNRDQLRSLANQKTDLEVKNNRADLNIKDLQRELKKLTDINQEKFQAHADIKPILKAAIGALRESVAASLPFKLEQRLQALKDIETKLETNIISPNKAANQLWAFVEDELILGRSSGIYNDTIEVDGQRKLVKVLRIGKIAMYFKTQDNQFGLLKKSAGEWRQQPVSDKEQVAQMEKLFDSFAKNIRNGIFTLPNFLPAS
jgi:hypothetical protein